MKLKKTLITALLLGTAVMASAQQEETASQQPDTTLTVLSLEDALKIALSENISVKVADQEIQRATYAKRGTYASLFPNVDGSAAYQRTIKKQVMYMDFDMSGMMGGGAGAGSGEGGEGQQRAATSGGGLEVGRWNTFSAGVTASMPLVNAQLWQSLSISGDEVELAVEKARSSRLGMVNEVKNAFYAVLLAKEANKVYEQVYANAVENLQVTQMKYNVQKASEMELVRAKTSVASAVPNVYNSRNNIGLSLWQLKAVLGLDLDRNIDVKGSLADYADQMFYDIHQHDDFSLASNTTLRQLDIQLSELAKSVKLNQYAYIPSLALAFNYSYNAMTNDFNFKEYKWTPYSYVGLSLNIPIFSGGKRYHAVRQSQTQLEQVRLQRVNTERQLMIAIRNDLSTMETQMNSYIAAQSAVESAQKGYDITAKSYNVGRSTLVELNDALLARAQAELMQWQAIYSFLVAKSDLEKQLGQDFIEE